MTDLEKLFQFGAETARHLFTAQGYLIPMWVGVNEKGAHIPLRATDLDDKDQTAEIVRRFLKKNNIVRYVSMLECWTYEGKDPPKELLEGQSLEHNPDRREGVHILAEDRSGDNCSGMYYILRPEHGKPTLSPFKVNGQAEKTEGRFVNLFA